MAERSDEVRRIAWSELFPFLRLFRAFHFSKRPSRLAVALAAVLICYAAGRLLDSIWLAAGNGVSRETLARAGMMSDATTEQKAQAFGPFAVWLQIDAAAVGGLAESALAIVGPGRSNWVGTFQSVIGAKMWLLWHRPFFAITFGLIVLAVASFAGGAIARQVALESARGEHISMFDALRFARDYWFDLAAGPLFAVVILLIFGLLLYLAGLVGAIPWVGELLTGLLLPLGLATGFVMALVVLALLLGFHLMWPTIAVECSDKFDAVSHAFSFVGRRPWHLAFYALLSLIYGGICYVMMRLIAYLTLKFTHVALAAGMGVGGPGEGGLRKLQRMWDMPGLDQFSILPAGGRFFYGNFFNATLGPLEQFSTYLIATWVFLVVGLLVAWLFSFWVSASVQMYFLLRRDVDRMEYSEIFYEDGALPPGVEHAPRTSGPPPSIAGQSLPVIDG